MDWIKRRTEPVDGKSFRVAGLSTIYSRNPLSSQKLSMALAKLFRMEQEGLEYYLDHPEHQEYCSACDKHFRVPDDEEYKYCPYCGRKR